MFTIEDEVPWKRVSCFGWNFGCPWAKSFGRDDLPDYPMLSTAHSVPSPGGPP